MRDFANNWEYPAILEKEVRVIIPIRFSDGGNGSWINCVVGGKLVGHIICNNGKYSFDSIDHKLNLTNKNSAAITTRCIEMQRRISGGS